MRDRKYKYVYQLIITSTLLVIIPVLFFYCIVWKKSIHEINYLNNEYYSNTLASFMGSFISETEEFKKHVVGFSIESGTSLTDSGIFFRGTEKMEEFPYYYGEASRKLSEYGTDYGYDNVGIYWYDNDVVISNGFKYSSLSRYLKDGLKIADEKECLYDFFSLDEFEYRQVMVAPLYDEEGVSTKCLIGICTILGKNKEKAMMFYQIDCNDMEYFRLFVHRDGETKYYIVDNETEEILFSVGATAEDYVLLQSTLQDLESEEPEESSQCFAKRNRDMGITFLLDVSEGGVQNKVIELYSSVRVLFAYILIIMISIGFITVYLNYKPLQRLVRKIGHKGNNEFEAILGAWEKQNALLTEQRMSIMGLLMNHLLYGIPISHRYVEKLGVSSDVRKYCVFVIGDYVLKNAEMDDLTQKVEELFGVLLFVNDIMGEKATVCVAFMEEDKSKTIKEWMNDWCRNHIGEGYKMRAGCVVDRLSDIQKSFSECTDMQQQAEVSPEQSEIPEKENISEKVRRRIVINEKLKDKILDYVDENFLDRELSQQQVADCFEISVYSLSKMFNGQIGTGFVDYINGKRIEYAKELLLTTGKNVKEIAVMVGFTNSKYFTEIFKKYTGTTPVEFRVEDK
ncbi:MAG: helix-turn-helix transcriptional regulator [Lachnospiraceae bacterium]|nr:helix-turn-helix transcriptional regulator [Lachnospiraceae bacterium]